MSFDFQSAYDQLNADDDDYRFYADLSHELGVHHVLDLGCGTGVLARLLAGGGATVVAIDPDPDMLRVARAKFGAEAVDWRLGYSDCADTAWADLAVMSGHVAQVFVREESSDLILRDLHRGLVTEGTLAFETRNPEARAWERWTRHGTLQTVATDDGPVEVWHETVNVALPQVTYSTFTRNLTTGQETSERNVLAFRDHDAIAASLRRAGYEVQAIFGDWSRAPLSHTSPEIIAIARRT